MNRVMSSRVVLAMALLLVVSGSGWALPAPMVVAQDAEDSEFLDLPAMALTPEDLEDEGLGGYGVGFGEVTYLDELIGPYAQDRNLPEDEVREILEDAGFARWYESFLDVPPDEDDPAGPSVRTFHSYVLEFANQDGAANGWDFLEDESTSETAHDVRRVKEFGDESEATRDRGKDEATGDEYELLDLSFRLGTLHAGVTIVDWAGGEPEVAEAEALAARLLERIELVLNDGAPGLSNQVVRLTGEEVASSVDSYLILDGDAIPIYRETARDTKAREQDAADADVTDAYWLREQIVARGEVPKVIVRYVVELRRFVDDVAARDWLAGVEQDIEGIGDYEDLVIDEDAPTFGDESLAFSATSANGTDRYRSVSLLVGATVAWIDVVGSEMPPATAVEALAEAQAACLEEGGCPEPLPLPDELADFAADLDD